jgi:hypothetical protein
LSLQTINQMKNVPAIISLATIGALLILSVAASLVESIPFAVVACYIIGFSGSIAFLAIFVADYGSRSSEPIKIVVKDAASERWTEVPADAGLGEHLTVSIFSTVSINEDPVTLSFS